MQISFDDRSGNRSRAGAAVAGVFTDDCDCDLGIVGRRIARKHRVVAFAPFHILAASVNFICRKTDHLDGSGLADKVHPGQALRGGRSVRAIDHRPEALFDSFVGLGFETMNLDHLRFEVFENLAVIAFDLFDEVWAIEGATVCD